MHDGDGIDQLIGQLPGYGRQHQGGAEHPPARMRRDLGRLRDAQLAAHPGGGIGDHVDRAHPGAIGTPADEGIKGNHDGHADQGGGEKAEHARRQHLQEDEGFNQGYGLEQPGAGEISLQDPDAAHRPGDEQADDGRLRDAAQDEPLVGAEPALGAQRILAQLFDRRNGHCFRLSIQFACVTSLPAGRG